MRRSCELCRSDPVSWTSCLCRASAPISVLAEPPVPAGQGVFSLSDHDPKTQKGTPMADQVIIFDTTLRDGEQSPGISLDTGEKLEIAEQLARLGVDYIEAGFPVASQGDFEAVQAIARTVQGPAIAG